MDSFKLLLYSGNFWQEMRVKQNWKAQKKVGWKMKVYKFAQ